MGTQSHYSANSQLPASSLLAAAGTSHASGADATIRLSLSNPFRPTPRESDLADIASLDGTILRAEPVPIHDSPQEGPRPSGLIHPSRPSPRDSGIADIASLDGTVLNGKPLA